MISNQYSEKVALGSSVSKITLAETLGTAECQQTN